MRRYVLLAGIVFTLFVLSLNMSSAYSQTNNAHLSFDKHPLVTGHSGLIKYFNSTLSGNGPDSPVTISVSTSCNSAFTLNLNESPYDDGYFYSTKITYNGLASCPATSPAPNPTDTNITLNVIENHLVNATSVSIPGMVDSLNVTSAGPSMIPWAFTRSDYNWADCADFGGDADEDNVCDNWEDQALHASNNRAPGLWIDYPYISENLSDMYHYPCDPDCPSPERKDIFLELDWMVNHPPDPNAMGNVTEAFSKAPFNFLHNTTHAGIKLHIQYNGVGDVLNDLTDGIIFPGIDHPRYQPGFDQVKAVHFGSPSERSANPVDWEEFKWKQKKQVFHYGMFVHSIKGQPGSSGDAEVWGNDLVISADGMPDHITTPQYQAGTLMHELGHNLKLAHGGPDSDLINCKPNYLSVMSYSYQLPLKDPHRQLSYSGYAHDPLNTNALVESDGVNHNPNQNGVTQNVVFGPVMPVPASNWKADGSWVDWNANGIEDTNTVQEYINFLPDEGCTDSEHGILNGFDDWAGINLNSRGTGNWAEGRMINQCAFPGHFANSTNGTITCLPLIMNVGKNMTDGKNMTANVNSNSSSFFDGYGNRIFASGISKEFTLSNYLHQLSSTVDLLNDSIQNLSAADFVNGTVSFKDDYNVETGIIREKILAGNLKSANDLLIDMRTTFDVNITNNRIIPLSAINNHILSQADNSLLAHANSLEPALNNSKHGPDTEDRNDVPSRVVCDEGDVLNNDEFCVSIGDFCGKGTKLVNDRCISISDGSSIGGSKIWGMLGPILAAITVIIGIICVALGWKLRRSPSNLSA